MGEFLSPDVLLPSEDTVNVVDKATDPFHSPRSPFGCQRPIVAFCLSYSLSRPRPRPPLATRLTPFQPGDLDQANASASASLRFDPELQSGQYTPGRSLAANEMQLCPRCTTSEVPSLGSAPSSGRCRSGFVAPVTRTSHLRHPTHAGADESSPSPGKAVAALRSAAMTSLRIRRRSAGSTRDRDDANQ